MLDSHNSQIPYSKEVDLLDSLIGNPSLHVILADEYEQYGDSYLAKYIRELDEHVWDDVSYHGSPVYECEVCGVEEYKEHPDKCNLRRRVDNFVMERRLCLSQELRDFEKIKYLLDKFNN